MSANNFVKPNLATLPENKRVWRSSEHELKSVTQLRRKRVFSRAKARISALEKAKSGNLVVQESLANESMSERLLKCLSSRRERVFSRAKAQISAAIEAKSGDPASECVPWSRKCASWWAQQLQAAVLCVITKTDLDCNLETAAKMQLCSVIEQLLGFRLHFADEGAEKAGVEAFEKKGKIRQPCATC